MFVSLMSATLLTQAVDLVVVSRGAIYHPRERLIGTISDEFFNRLIRRVQ